MSMNTMTLLDDYVDALLDGGALDAGRGHDRTEHDPGKHGRTEHDRVPPCPAAGMAMAWASAPAAADCPGDSACASPPAHAAVPEPAPAPAFVPAFVPAIVPALTPPPAAPPATARDTASAAREAPVATKAATSHRWIRVTVGDDSYGLELLRVQEVVRLAPIVALRGAARAVLGVMNLRGRIVPVIDLGLWLHAGCVHGDERSRIVVVERDDEMIGVLVSAVEDVVTLGRERIEPPLASSDPGAIVGIARVGAAPTVLLDANALFG